MNKQEADILLALLAAPFVNQRKLAEETGYSLGAVNSALKALVEKCYLDQDFCPTGQARQLCREKAPKNAIILAAGYGMRMVPINLSSPKALLQVGGEALIERMIRFLQAVGIREILVVVGFMKESFEYLIDQYGVELVVNAQYAAKNNLSSLALVADRIGDSYIIPADIWCPENPFSTRELYSWYMVSRQLSRESQVRVNRKQQLVRIGREEEGNAMVGIAYLTGQEAREIRQRLRIAAADPSHDEDFWEEVLYNKDKMSLLPRVVEPEAAVELNTYEQLRELDGDSKNLHSAALDVVARVFRVSPREVTGIRVLKKGMTNRSFLFSVRGEKYIMRIPGEGTEQLIDRAQEAEVFRTISGRGLCDDPVYINPENGYKITKFLEGVRVCDCDDPEDLKKAMAKLRQFHGMQLQVPHTFDIFQQIDFYESLWEGQPSVYRDYRQTKEKVLRLKPLVEGMERQWCLTHIDAVPDNFLFYRPDGAAEELQLTDWEYSGMQDPHVDIAMFCIYSLYSKQQVDRLIDIYFENRCEPAVRTKIYAYIAMCGLLWSNWCEFKRKLGVEFGEYSLRQYRFAKDYYGYAMQAMGE